MLHGAYREFFIFIGFEVSVTLYPFVAPSQQRRAEKFALGGLAAMLAILTVMYETIMGTFGPSYIPYIRWPMVSLMRIVRISGFFVDKWGSLVVALWTIAVLGFLAVRLWCLAHDAATLFFVHSGKSYRYFLVASALVAYGAASMIPNATLTDEFTENLLIPLGLLYLTGIPVFLLTISALRPNTLKKLRHLGAGEPQNPP
jgi:spore germination protein